ncbi:MAG: hypothetical protein AB7O59_14150 [Pirellulales bacterium]
MDYTQPVRENRENLLSELDRAIAKVLAPLEQALDAFLALLFRGKLPLDWREQWQAFVAEERASGFAIESDSSQEMEVWINAWAEFCGLLPAETGTGSEQTTDGDYPLLNSSLVYEFSTVERPPRMNIGPEEPPTRRSRKGTSRQFGLDSEAIASEATDVPLNRGPNQHRIPAMPRGAKGKPKRKAYRIPDLKVRGKDGSLRRINAIVEVKAVKDPKTGGLSARSIHQIEDAVAYIRKVREKARLVKNQALKDRLAQSHVKLYTDLAQPKIGRPSTFVETRILQWNRIPTLRVKTTSSAIVKPGLGMAENVALGTIISLVEANVANEYYRSAAQSLNDLLDQIAANGDADEQGWRTIKQRLDAIASMKQSILGSLWEFISYGQGSLQEQQGAAMMFFAGELAEKYGYEHQLTWSDAFDAKPGRFKRKSK